MSDSLISNYTVTGGEGKLVRRPKLVRAAMLLATLIGPSQVRHGNGYTLTKRENARPCRLHSNCSAVPPATGRGRCSCKAATTLPLSLNYAPSYVLLTLLSSANCRWASLYKRTV